MKNDLSEINDLAKQHFDRKEFHEALKLLDRSDLPEELIPNLAKCYYYTSQAYKALDLVLPLKKTQNLWIDIALYYNALGDSKSAFDIYKTLDQNDPKVKFNIGWHYLSKNEFQKGFQHLKYGDQCHAWGHEYIHLAKGSLKKEKRWNGEKTDHLLLILEGGLGDEMIFLRWANYLKTKCNHLTILCSQSLLRLLTNAGYNCQPHSVLDRIEYTHYCPAMSLPAIDTTIEFPTDKVIFPYIKSFTEPYITKQMDMISQGRKKIGVRFFGNKEFEHDQFRSPPKDALLGLERFGQLFSLQIDEENSNIPNCKHLIRDWQDTYSVFTGLDLLVTSCTSTIHLAGAMGIRAIVLIPLVPYFVWASDTMRWYQNNVTVIQQTRYGDWSEAIERLYHEISRI